MPISPEDERRLLNMAAEIERVREPIVFRLEAPRAMDYVLPTMTDMTWQHPDTQNPRSISKKEMARRRAKGKVARASRKANKMRGK